MAVYPKRIAALGWGVIADLLSVATFGLISASEESGDTYTKDFTIDGIVKEILSKTFTIDGVVATRNTETITVDGIVAERKTATFTLDGLIISTKNYSREATNNLPIDNTGLETLYSTDEVTDVGVDNDEYVSICATSSLGRYKIHQFTYKHTNNTDTISIAVKAKTNKAPSSSEVYLQIYNNTAEEWETLDTESSAEASIEFELNGSKEENLENYYGVSNFVSIRVYQDA